MVNEPDNIDRLFRDRFDGLKDHSIDPSRQWAKFESAVNSSASHSVHQASAASGYSGVMSLAAASASLIMVAGIFNGDTDIVHRQTTQAEVVASAPVQVNSSNEESSVTTFSFEHDHSFASADAAKEVEESPSSGLGDNRISLNSSSNATGDSEIDAAASSQTDAITWHEPVSDAESVLNLTAERNAPALAFLPTLGFSEGSEMTIIERESETYQPSRKTWKKDQQVYGRASFRIGNGESNSSERPALWSLNLALALGYSHEINQRIFVTGEVGWLRRSGNSLERMKEVDFSPINTVVIALYGTAADSPQEPALSVHQSLIATKLDYLHFPVAIHLQTSEKTNASVGGYAEYLVFAQNESFRVFNSTSYVGREYLFGEERSKAGLNRLRFGISGAFDYDLNPKMSVSAKGMIPLNSALVNDSDYLIINKANQLVDFQVGVKYRI